MAARPDSTNPKIPKILIQTTNRRNAQFILFNKIHP